MNASEYIQTAKSIKERIKKLDQIIDGLMTVSIEQIENSGKASYSLNDGQTTINVSFRSGSEITAAIRKYEQLKNSYINKLNGNVTYLKDYRSL